MAHEHGAHICYCPECNYEVEVDAYVKCNTQYCPQCGARMRAKETGEYHSTKAVAAIASKVSTTENLPCPVCGFPVPAPSHVGQQVKCAWCGSINEAITQVTIPTPVFVGILCFGAGVLLGPVFWATTKGGSEWLARLAREHIK